MPDVFISYSSSDERIAKFVHDHLVAEGVSAFLASVSLKPGDKWTPVIFNNLNAASWLIFLASSKACSSPYVLQELGAALAGQKKLVPIVWDMSPSQLPGWVNQHHALVLTGRTFEDLRMEIVNVAQRIKADKQKGLVVLGLVIAGLAAFSK